MSDKKLVRKNGKIAGVCGGIAEFFGIDVTIIRIIWLVAFLCYGTGLLAYLIMLLVMPQE